MRNLKSYISLFFMGCLALTSCQNDFDDPGYANPKSTWLSDTEGYECMTIAQIKEQYWNDATNYYASIGESENGKHILVKGRVISSDAAGNIYKSLVIQDETGALAMSINANSMNNTYRPGQELVIDLTGMTIGKYAGLQQLGFPDDSEQYGAQTTFMPYQFFREHSQMNERPDLAKIDTLLIRSSSDLSGGPEVLRKYQSQLVRFNDCWFENGGVETFAEKQETVSQTLNLSDGGTIDVRTSGYSNFYNKMLPSGHGDVVGILSYFNTDWQLLLIDVDGCMNFGNPTIGPGAEDNPYTVDEAISVINGGGSATSVWITGYIVGAVAPGVQSVASNDDIQFGKVVDLDNTLVFAQDPDCEDWTKCMVVSLPQDSKLRQYGNLVDNPDNFQKQIWLKGNLATSLDMPALTGNDGSASNFRIDGVDVPADEGGNLNPDFNTMNNGEATGYYGTYTSATGWVATNAQLLRGGSTDASPVFTIFGDASVYAVGLNGNTSKAGTLTSPTISGGLKTLSFDYCQPFNDNGKAKLTINIKQNGAIVATDVLEKDGMTKLTKYSYSHDFNITGSFVIEIINNSPSGVAENKDRIAIWNLSDGTSGGETPGPDTPDTPVGGFNPDFSTMNNGEATAYYVTMTSNTGWVATNAQLLQGGTADNSPVFTVFGDASVYAIGLNGNTTKPGSLVSPVMSGGLKTFSFYYVQVFNDNGKAKLTINIKQNGAVVASDVLEKDGMVKMEKYAYTHDFNVTGDYQIEIINDSPSAEAANKDRVAIWGLTNGSLGGGGTVTPDPTPDPVTGNSADFSAFGSTATTYATYTSSTGWVAEWAQILSGSDAPDNKNTFALFGTDKDFAVCLNGNTGKVGKLTSPTISGGLKTLTFDYGFVYADTKAKLNINILQNGTVVASDVLDNSSMTKNEKYTYSHDFNVSGSFVIEIVNASPSNSASNKDRTAIWNLSWTN